MTEPNEEGSTGDLKMPTGEVEFRGRTMSVRMPRPEQLVVWKRTLVRLQSANPESWTAAEVMAALERTRKIIDSLLVNSADVDWLDDEMLAGNFTFKDTSVLVNDIVKAFEGEGNRAARRAAKKTPAKKATRKKAS